MYLGVDYYPEQWEENMLDGDMDRIVELGCNTIRIAEFSWHLMEKREGEFDFSFFDRVIEKAKERGLFVIMGTPTATIPAWLAYKHPEILSEFENGKKRTFGGRHNYCFSSDCLYEYSEKIVRALVSHYKDERAIIAWQIDNEIGHEGSDICFCKNCHRKFQSFLKEKFGGDIERLNYTYGTTFWSQEYNSFDEIPLPSETITTHNPALRLDWERFRSRLIVDFIAFQARLIREISPDAVLMHDFPGGGLTKHVDYSKVAKLIDKSGYNNYPVWGGQKAPLKPHEIAFGLDYIRGLKGENFWITEAIIGAQGHDVTGYLPRPDQAKMWSYQAMAHGGEALLYFRYREATKGAEQFCYGVIDADNVLRRKFYEAQSFFSDIAFYESALSSKIQNDVAIVYDYDSLASFRIQRQSVLSDVPQQMTKLYKLFYDLNVGVDIIPEDRDFSNKKIVVLPQLIITKPDMEQRVKNFVYNGGIVIFTYRSAVKDENNNLFFGKTIPVNYTELLGITVEETESLQDEESFEVAGSCEFDGVFGKGGIFRDMIKPIDAEVLFRYGDRFPIRNFDPSFNVSAAGEHPAFSYKEFAAVTKKKSGKGQAYYIGCGLTEQVLKQIVNSVLEKAKIKPLISPDGVEVVNRRSNKQSITIYINHNNFAARANGINLAPFECKVVEE
ncbi:MAG: beta-galactosidase [Ruminococcus sp.]|nr:beta-galactosidase [Ruminococcus sp.]